MIVVAEIMRSLAMEFALPSFMKVSAPEGCREDAVLQRFQALSIIFNAFNIVIKTVMHMSHFRCFEINRYMHLHALCLCIGIDG